LKKIDKVNEPSTDWPVTFEQVEEDQLCQMLKATPAQRLVMAEELQMLAIKAGALRIK